MVCSVTLLVPQEHPLPGQPRGGTEWAHVVLHDVWLSADEDEPDGLRRVRPGRLVEVRLPAYEIPRLLNEHGRLRDGYVTAVTCDLADIVALLGRSTSPDGARRSLRVVTP